MAEAKPISINAIETIRFWKYVNKSKSCWLWTGGKTGHGYGMFWAGKRVVPAHRVSWLLAHGNPITTSLVLDHLCRNPSCVNPSHLEPVTQQVNILRGVGITAQHARKTSCKRGHPFTPDNTNYRLKGRECRECRRFHKRMSARAVAFMNRSNKRKSA